MHLWIDWIGINFKTEEIVQHISLIMKEKEEMTQEEKRCQASNKQNIMPGCTS